MALITLRSCLLIALVIAACNAKKVYIKSLDIKVNPNEYFDSMTSAVNSDGTVSVTLPLKKSFDDRLQVKSSIQVAGWSFISNRVIPICEDIKKGDHSVLKPIYDKIEPAALFSKTCPVPTRTWKVDKFRVDTSFFSPFGWAVTGSFQGEMELGDSNEKPIIKIVVSGHIPFFGRHSSNSTENNDTDTSVESCS